MSFRSSNIINLDEQQQSESLFEAFGEHPVLGYTSFDILKKFATDKEQHLQVELELLQQAYAQALTANLAKVLLPCSGLLLEELEFKLFSEVLSKQQGQSQICLLFDDQEIRYACATQLENLKKLSSLGYSIGLNNFAKDRCELNALTEIDFDYILLSSTFSKRVLQQDSFNLQLQGVLAITKLKHIKVIAKGPSILNFRTLLDKYGLNLFVGKQQVISQPETSTNNAAQSL
ncbi:EAL domain-containing protein [Pseudoalteromonas espejiana]